MALPISDGVIVLDRFGDLDVDAHVAGEDDEHARRFGWFPARSTRETVAAAIRGWNQDWESSGPTRGLAARRATSRVLVGGCELRLLGASAAEMSYWIFPAHRRRGYGTRVAELAVAYAFDSLGVEQIDLLIQPDNAASLGVARKAGFAEVEVTRSPLGPGEPPVEVVRFRCGRSKRGLGGSR